MTAAQALEHLGGGNARPRVLDRSLHLGAQVFVQRRVLAIEGAQRRADDFAGGRVFSRLQPRFKARLLGAEGDRYGLAGSHGDAPSCSSCTTLYDTVIQFSPIAGTPSGR